MAEERERGDGCWVTRDSTRAEKLATLALLFSAYAMRLGLGEVLDVRRDE